MEIQDFLQALVPAGVIVVARKVTRTNAEGKSYPSMAHTTASNYAYAQEVIEQYEPDHDVYFALASYAQGFHLDAKGKKVIRVRENVKALKALWFDIDFKGAYPDAKSAVLGLRAFSEASSLPPPSIIVGSGNGLHAYWPLDRELPLKHWQRLADALKNAAKEHGLAADLACTGDPCRVLRPPNTHNRKNAAKPKPVKVLHTSGKVFKTVDIAKLLVPYLQTRAAPAAKGAKTVDVNDDLTGGVGLGPQRPSSFEVIQKHCGVAKHIVTTRGEHAQEPEWTATLQLLKHCEDGPLWVHTVSDKHPGYTPDSTDKKFEQRKANTAGPTLCSTFGQYHPGICKLCPNNGFVKTPLQLGHEESATTSGADEYPFGWRVSPDKKGVDRLMMVPGEDGKLVQEWQRQLNYFPLGLRATRSVITQNIDLAFQVGYRDSKPVEVLIPAALLGNSMRLNEAMSSKGLTLHDNEPRAFSKLMSTWLRKLREAARVADVTENLGWLMDGEKIVGFSCGPMTFHADGRERADVKVAKEFASISKHYEPRGALEPWKRVSSFLAQQNNPAFVAVLAASFGAPLLKFTGVTGALLSIVSTASGVGKSSALKCSQAVWGSPTHGMNAVDDTTKSVARKLGFLNNLPAYWDELRGKKIIEDFVQLAFQITQGKEKTRLDSTATLREIQTWETMLIVASNESILDAMARQGGGSDAGLVRTYEIYLDAFTMDRNRAEVTLLFEQLNQNYGHAGRIYAKHLATHADEIAERTREMFTRLANVGNMQPQERFWFAIMAVLVVGAETASKLDIVKIDVPGLLKFLMKNLQSLRGQSVATLEPTSPMALFAQFMQEYQNHTLLVEQYPNGTSNLSGYLPEVIGVPAHDKMIFHVSRKEKQVRFAVDTLMRWLERRGLPSHSHLREMVGSLGMYERRLRLGAGTKWEVPPQKVLQVTIDGPQAAALFTEQSPGLADQDSANTPPDPES